MSNQLIKTRIKNKIDTLAQWIEKNPVLLLGEIAFVQVPTGETYVNPVTGADEPVVELLMKVGDGVHKFNEVDASTGKAYLPWLSAKASDVYNWAKAEKLAADDVPELPVERIIVTPDDPATEDKNEKVTLADKLGAIAQDIAGLSSTIASGVRFIGTVTAKPSAGSNTVKISGQNVDTDAKVGDLVLHAETGIEYLCVAVTGDMRWQELGDQSRLGTLETKISGFDLNPTTAAEDATTFISSIKEDTDTTSETCGKLIVTTAKLPEATNAVKGIVTLGAPGGAATYADVNGESGALKRLSAVESNYVMYTANTEDNNKPGTLSIGANSKAEDYIIFDCGGASI